MSFPIVYVVTRNTNGVYKSIDGGATFVQTGTNNLTSQVTDVALSDRPESHSVILYGDGPTTTPYYSFNDGASYQAGENTVGKEVTYVGQFTYVFGSTNSASGSGAILEMSFDEGMSIGATIDVTSLFNYAGAVYNNITITGFDFTNSAGGYITIAGDQNNGAADQILTRTYDRGVSFPNALILPGNLGIIRGVWVSPERNVVFAIGEPDTIRGVLYSINPSLTEAPVKVLDNFMAGSIANDLTVKFASVPPTYNTSATFEDPTIQYIKFKSKVYFLDSSGKVYYSDDYGFTWEYRSTVPGVCVDIVALSENTVLVLSKSPTSVFKSVDGGFTFIENPQASWVDPKAISHVASTDCSHCNPGFTPTMATIGFCKREDRYIGTLCNPPYIYSEFLAACAKPSTIVPTNLIISLDYSNSVEFNERLLFRKYIELLISKLEDRLLDGSMKVAIIGWSSQACLQQPFTSDINLLYTALYTDPPIVQGAGCFQNGTNHTEAMCLAIRTLYEESLLRPDAENVLALFTDGANGYEANPLSYSGCDLSDIGLLPVVPPDTAQDNIVFWDHEQLDMYRLVKNAKEQLNNGKGFKLIATILGNTVERESVKDFLITYPVSNLNSGPLGPDYAVPSRIPNTDKYYFLDGGTFDNAQFIADQIRLGLAAEVVSSPTCPDGCIPKAGIDNLGYCSCDERLAWTDCTFDIKNCDTGEVVAVKSQFIAITPGTVIRLNPQGAVDSTYNPWFYDGGAGCWLVVETGIANPNISYIRPDVSAGGYGGYPSCSACALPPWYRLTDCLDNTFIIYTQNPEFQTLLDAGTDTITHNNYPDRCFLIENIGSDNTYEESNITFSGIDFKGLGCQSCPRQQAVNFKLTRLNLDCSSDPTNIIYSLGLTSDLQPYISQIVNLEGFSNICWLVELDSEIQTVYQPVVVTNAYPTCTDCQPPITYRFVNSCEDSNVVLYSNQDFSQYVGQIVNLQEYPGNCFLCDLSTDNSPSVQNLTINGEPYASCPDCLVTYYQLTNCANPNVILISQSTELSRYLGKTITAAGYTGLCFTVTQPKCDCIRVTINGVEYDAYAQTNQFNGRNVYYITTDAGDELSIAWSVNPNRWELFDRTTLNAYGFNTKDSDCPFSNYWTIIQGSPYIITTVSFCADRIYNIAPELEFIDCQPCINCI